MRQRTSSSRAHNNTVSCLIPMESESVTSINTTPILDHIKKQLCDDIEAAGGIGKVADGNNIQQGLKYICDINTSLYGTCASDKRKQIRNLVDYWKKLAKNGTYNRLVLHRYKVPSYSSRTQTKPPQASASDSSSSSSSSSDLSEQEKPPPKQRSVTPPRQQVTPPRRFRFVLNLCRLSR